MNESSRSLETSERLFRLSTFFLGELCSLFSLFLLATLFFLALLLSFLSIVVRDIGVQRDRSKARSENDGSLPRCRLIFVSLSLSLSALVVPVEGKKKKKACVGDSDANHRWSAKETMVPESPPPHAPSPPASAAPDSGGVAERLERMAAAVRRGQFEEV